MVGDVSPALCSTMVADSVDGFFHPALKPSVQNVSVGMSVLVMELSLESLLRLSRSSPGRIKCMNASVVQMKEGGSKDVSYVQHYRTKTSQNAHFIFPYRPMYLTNTRRFFLNGQHEQK